MRVRTSFPRSVVVRETWVPMPDGIRLHARIWLPEDADHDPVPALLEYLPYRKGDWTAPRDAQRHPWYAGHGYASVRVDIRGTGNSEGTMTDEYTPTELSDGVAVVEWLAAQSWCSGNVGMFGISWGGFNALQVAALGPPALKAIVTVCSTDDRYDNDVHYVGGAVLGVDMVAWAGTMLAFTARPPDPAVVGPSWREQWRRRIDALEPFATTWLSHQERDDYWRHGSVCEDYTAITAAVLAVGGFADPYRDTVLRLVEHLPGPVRGLLGPWAHQYPDIERPPGPAIGFLQETLGWWDHWLKGADNGAMDAPLLRAFLQDGVPPATCYRERSGRWVAAEVWPPPQQRWRRMELSSMSASHPRDDRGQVLVRTAQHTGVDAGRFFPFGNATDLPPDQREEDARSVCFDSAPLTTPLPLLGRAVARLLIRCDVERAHVIVRLCDVAPDGASTLVTRGVLNLTKRQGRAASVPWKPGASEEVTVPLTAGSHVLPADHRLRVAVSATYWPWVWPHPEPTTLWVLPEHSHVDVPAWQEAEPPGRDQPSLVEPEPEQAQPLPVQSVPGAFPPGPERRVVRDLASGEWTLEVDPRYAEARTYPDGLTYQEHAREVYRIGSDPLSASADSSWEIRLNRDEWLAEVSASTHVHATPAEFVVESSVEARDAAGAVAERRWTHRVPRTSA